MRSQPDRDQQTVTIATGLVTFLGILVAGTLLGTVIDAVGDLSENAAKALTLGTVLVAGVVCLSYLVRHRRT